MLSALIHFSLYPIGVLTESLCTENSMYIDEGCVFCVHFTFEPEKHKNN